MEYNFYGTGIALITPFKNGKVDFIALEKLINHCIEGKVEYLVSLGTTGESVTLSKEEKKDILRFTAEVNNGRVALVAGFGGNNTSEVCTDLQSFDSEHYKAILSASPYYNKPTQQGIYAHYEAISKASPLPIILYNVPGRTASNILPSTTIKLANNFENIIAIKEASGNIEQCMQIIKQKPAHFTVISGDDALTLPFLSIGMKGLISVVGNAYPFEISEMVRQYLSGNFEKAQNLHYTMLNLINALFEEGNPGGIKSVLHYMNICENELRLPLVKISQELQDKIKTLMW